MSSTLSPTRGVTSPTPTWPLAHRPGFHSGYRPFSQAIINSQELAAIRKLPSTKSSVEVVILDDFQRESNAPADQGFEPPEEPTHGDLVHETIRMLTPWATIHRRQAAIAEIQPKDLEENVSLEKVKRVFRNALVREANQIKDEIHKANGKRIIINQSYGLDINTIRDTIQQLLVDPFSNQMMITPNNDRLWTDLLRLHQLSEESPTDKLFGWLPSVRQQQQARRKQELSQLRRRDESIVHILIEEATRNVIKSDTLKDGAQKLRKVLRNAPANVLFVRSAGNSGGGRRLEPESGDIAVSPIAFRSKNILQVAAASDLGESDGDSNIKHFSSRSLGNSVSADGSFTLPSGRLFEGTSAAAPVVTALAEKLWSMHPKMTAGELKNVLTSTANNTDASDAEEGYGRINPEAAARKVMQKF